MRFTACFLFLILWIKSSSAQDIIIQTDGTTIQAVVQEVGVAEVKYKKYENRLTSPVYVLPKYLITRINYADGTSDVFTPAVVTPVSSATSPGTSAYTTPSTALYFGGGIVPFSKYQGGDINTYWQNQFAGQSPGSGSLKMNTGNTRLYDFTLGMTVIGSKRNNWTYECEFETSPSNGLSNTASFADGTTGSLNLRFSSLNTTFQYTRGLDTTNRFQLGAEGSMDVGFVTGKETDFFANITSYYQQQTVTNNYEGAGIGGHFAVVGKYYLNKKKNFGLEVKAGYRKMQVTTDNYSVNSNSLNSSVNWGGPFVSASLILQINIKPSPYQYAYYGCGCY